MKIGISNVGELLVVLQNKDGKVIGEIVLE